MTKNETLDAMLAGGVVAVIRMKDVDRLSRVVMAIREGGVKCIEITMTVPGARRPANGSRFASRGGRAALHGSAPSARTTETGTLAIDRPE